MTASAGAGAGTKTAAGISTGAATNAGVSVARDVVDTLTSDAPTLRRPFDPNARRAFAGDLCSAEEKRLPAALTVYG
jgi:hypothetical protein